MYSNNHYNKNLQHFASDLRKRMTKAEACLWKYALKSKKMKGYTFRRQRPVLRFIADFLCLELKLVIEVDGITHLYQSTKRKDKIKEMALRSNGFEVLRFTDGEVLRSMELVIKEIQLAIERLESEKNHF